MVAMCPRGNVWVGEKYVTTWTHGVARDTLLLSTTLNFIYLVRIYLFIFINYLQSLYYHVYINDWLSWCSLKWFGCHKVRLLACLKRLRYASPLKDEIFIKYERRKPWLVMWWFPSPGSVWCWCCVFCRCDLDNTLQLQLHRHLG